jgi:hypothetical protein
MSEPTNSPQRVTYGRLDADARAEILDWHGQGVTIAGYVRACWPDGVWRGDRCGCTDDRCIGYHHDEDHRCGCLPVLVERYALELVYLGAQP